MKENGIFIKSMYECMANNKKDINNMDKIFDSDDELSIRKRLVLLKLISRNRANENMKYYINAKNISAESFETDMETFKALIVTSLMFNLDFYVSACNWCGLIQAEVRKIKAKVIIPATKKENTQRRYKIVRIKPFAIPKEKKNAATPKNEEEVYKYFFKNTITYKEISGTLIFFGDKYKRVYLEFIFDECTEKFKKIPFELKICFNTVHEPKKHTIDISDNNLSEDIERYITSMSSGIYEDIDYSGGIEGECNVSLKPLTNL
jgi:hypothetical protein